VVKVKRFRRILYNSNPFSFLLHWRKTYNGFISRVFYNRAIIVIMVSQHERVLVVDNDPDSCDFIVRQILQPMGFHVEVAGAAAQAIQAAGRFSPDLILANLRLPGLSGKDLLVALSSQGLEAPIIVIANKGMEGAVIQAFRLGASDYLLSPLREAEVVAAVERGLKQVRERKEKEQLARQLNQTNQELQRRVRELTTIFAIGKAVTSITNQQALLDKIVEGAVYVTEADSGWLLLRDEKGKNFLLSACKNMPGSISDQIGQPWEDGISNLVALSGESLSIYGEPLKRFKVARLGQSALVVPVKAKKEVVGLLVVIRSAAQSFGPTNQALLEAVADYASISLLNAQLFKALEERARSLQLAAESAAASEHIKDEILEDINQELHDPLMDSLSKVHALLETNKAALSPDQCLSLQAVETGLGNLLEVVETVSDLQRRDYSNQKAVIDLNELARQTVGRYYKIAERAGINLSAHLASYPVSVVGNASHLARVMESFVSNAIKFSLKGGRVTIGVKAIKEGEAVWSLVRVQDRGIGIDPQSLKKVFDPSFHGAEPDEQRFGGLGIGLSLVKEIVLAHAGKIWAESEPGKGSSFYIALPSANK
jgi:signal transduction histidine kinase/DNA-binding response OmpR family regulator